MEQTKTIKKSNLVHTLLALVVAVAVFAGVLMVSPSTPVRADNANDDAQVIPEGAVGTWYSDDFDGHDVFMQVDADGTVTIWVFPVVSFGDPGYPHPEHWEARTQAYTARVKGAEFLPAEAARDCADYLDTSVGCDRGCDECTDAVPAMIVIRDGLEIGERTTDPTTTAVRFVAIILGDDLSVSAVGGVPVLDDGTEDGVLESVPVAISGWDAGADGYFADNLAQRIADVIDATVGHVVDAIEAAVNTPCPTGSDNLMYSDESIRAARAAIAPLLSEDIVHIYQAWAALRTLVGADASVTGEQLFDAGYISDFINGVLDGLELTAAAATELLIQEFLSEIADATGAQGNSFVEDVETTINQINAAIASLETLNRVELNEKIDLINEGIANAVLSAIAFLEGFEDGAFADLATEGLVWEIFARLAADTDNDVDHISTGTLETQEDRADLLNAAFDLSEAISAAGARYDAFVEGQYTRASRAALADAIIDAEGAYEYAGRTVETLEAALAALEAAMAVGANGLVRINAGMVQELINGLPVASDVTLAHNSIIQSVRTAVEDLTVADRATLDQTMLTNAETAISNILVRVNTVRLNIIAVANVKYTAPAAGLTVDEAIFAVRNEQVATARASFDALSAAERGELETGAVAGLVITPPANFGDLNFTEMLLAAEAMVARLQAEVDAALELILLVPEEGITLAHVVLVQEARSAFDALSPAQRAAILLPVDDDNQLIIIVTAEARIEESQNEVNDVNSIIAGWAPVATNISLLHEVVVQNIRNRVDDMDYAMRAAISDANHALLSQAETLIRRLVAELDAAIAAIEAIGVVNEDNVSDAEGLVDTARGLVDDLNPDQYQVLVNRNLSVTLQNAEATIAGINALAVAEVVSLMELAVEATVPFDRQADVNSLSAADVAITRARDAFDDLTDTQQSAFLMYGTDPVFGVTPGAHSGLYYSFATAEIHVDLVLDLALEIIRLDAVNLAGLNPDQTIEFLLDVLEADAERTELRDVYNAAYLLLGDLSEMLDDIITSLIDVIEELRNDVYDLLAALYDVYLGNAIERQEEIEYARARYNALGDVVGGHPVIDVDSNIVGRLPEDNIDLLVSAENYLAAALFIEFVTTYINSGCDAACECGDCIALSDLSVANADDVGEAASRRNDLSSAARSIVDGAGDYISYVNIAVVLVAIDALRDINVVAVVNLAVAETVADRQAEIDAADVLYLALTAAERAVVAEINASLVLANVLSTLDIALAVIAIERLPGFDTINPDNIDYNADCDDEACVGPCTATCWAYSHYEVYTAVAAIVDALSSAQRVRVGNLEAFGLVRQRVAVVREAIRIVGLISQIDIEEVADLDPISVAQDVRDALAYLNAYDAMEGTVSAFITNRGDLEVAFVVLLIAELADFYAMNNVSAILGEADYVEEARAAYMALAADLREYVTNIEVLLVAEVFVQIAEVYDDAQSPLNSVGDARGEFLAHEARVVAANKSVADLEDIDLVEDYLSTFILDVLDTLTSDLLAYNILRAQVAVDAIRLVPGIVTAVPPATFADHVSVWTARAALDALTGTQLAIIRGWEVDEANPFPAVAFEHSYYGVFVLIEEYIDAFFIPEQLGYIIELILANLPADYADVEMGHMAAVEGILDAIDHVPTLRREYADHLDDEGTALVDRLTAHAATMDDVPVGVTGEYLLARLAAAIDALIVLLDEVEYVFDLIDELPDVVTRLNEDAVTEAREAFDALCPAQQALVTNYEALRDAEAQRAALRAEEAQAEFLISVMPTAATLAHLDLVAQARAAFDAIGLDDDMLELGYVFGTVREGVALVDFIAGLESRLEAAEASIVAQIADALAVGILIEALLVDSSYITLDIVATRANALADAVDASAYLPLALAGLVEDLGEAIVNATSDLLDDINDVANASTLTALFTVNSAYNNLTFLQRALIDGDLVTLLDKAVEAALEHAEAMLEALIRLAEELIASERFTEASEDALADAIGVARDALAYDERTVDTLIEATEDLQAALDALVSNARQALIEMIEYAEGYFTDGVGYTTATLTALREAITTAEGVLDDLGTGYNEAHDASYEAQVEALQAAINNLVTLAEEGINLFRMAMIELGLESMEAIDLLTVENAQGVSMVSGMFDALTVEQRELVNVYEWCVDANEGEGGYVLTIDYIAILEAAIAQIAAEVAGVINDMIDDINLSEPPTDDEIAAVLAARAAYNNPSLVIPGNPELRQNIVYAIRDLVDTVALVDLEAIIAASGCPYELAVANALAAIAAATFEALAQADVYNAILAQSAMLAVISDLVTDVTVTINLVEWTAAVAGTEQDEDGDNGLFLFTVTVVAGEAPGTVVENTSVQRSVVITATVYVPTTYSREYADLLAARAAAALRDEADYTASSWDALQDALDAAAELDDSDDAADLIAATESILAAIAGLLEIAPINELIEEIDTMPAVILNNAADIRAIYARFNVLTDEDGDYGYAVEYVTNHQALITAIATLATMEGEAADLRGDIADKVDVIAGIAAQIDELAEDAPAAVRAALIVSLLNALEAMDELLADLDELYYGAPAETGLFASVTSETPAVCEAAECGNYGGVYGPFCSRECLDAFLADMVDLVADKVDDVAQGLVDDLIAAVDAAVAFVAGDVRTIEAIDAARNAVVDALAALEALLEAAVVDVDGLGFGRFVCVLDAEDYTCECDPLADLKAAAAKAVLDLTVVCRCPARECCDCTCDPLACECTDEATCCECGLSPMAIVGIVLASIAVLAGILAAVYFFVLLPKGWDVKKIMAKVTGKSVEADASDADDDDDDDDADDADDDDADEPALVEAAKEDVASADDADEDVEEVEEVEESDDEEDVDDDDVFTVEEADDADAE